MNIDYNAVMEILKNFLENEKTEILGISVGEEIQVRDAIGNLLTAYEKEKEKNKKAKEFIKENSHEFNCKRDDLIELEFDNNTNATDLIDILDGNW